MAPYGAIFLYVKKIKSLLEYVKKMNKLREGSVFSFYRYIASTHVEASSLKFYEWHYYCYINILLGIYQFNYKE